MVQKLLRVVDEPTRHKVLDLIFLGAIGLGFINGFNCYRAITEYGQVKPENFVQLFHMILFAFAGALGYWAHLKGLVWYEFATILPVVAGYAVIVLNSLQTLTTSPIAVPFMLSMGGLVPAVGLWLIIDAIDRFRMVNGRRRQIKKSKELRTRESAENNVEEIIKMAGERSSKEV